MSSVQPITIVRTVVGVVIAAALLYAPFYYEAPDNKVLSQVIYIAIAAMGPPWRRRASVS